MNDTVGIRGSCHCGNIRFELSWPQPATEMPARRCGCRFCRKHGGVWTSNSRSALTVAVEDDAAVTKYAFATGTADFHVCNRCGVVPLVTSAIDGRLYAVVNVNTFDDAGPLRLSTSPASFDGEGTAGRLERRKRNWIPAVSIRRAGV